MISDLAQIGLAGIGIVVIAFVVSIGGSIALFIGAALWAAIGEMNRKTMEAWQLRHDQISTAWFKWLDSRWP